MYILAQILSHGPLVSTEPATEVEYWAVASTTAELLWLQNLFSKLHLQPLTKLVVYYDNLGTTHVCANSVFYSKMKHLALDYHFVRENV